MTVNEFIENQKAIESQFTVTVNLMSPNMETANFGTDHFDANSRASLLRRYGDKQVEKCVTIPGGKFGTIYRITTKGA